MFEMVETCWNPCDSRSSYSLVLGGFARQMEVTPLSTPPSPSSNLLDKPENGPDAETRGETIGNNHHHHHHHPFKRQTLRNPLFSFDSSPLLAPTNLPFGFNTVARHIHLLVLPPRNVQALGEMGVFWNGWDPNFSDIPTESLELRKDLLYIKIAVRNGFLRPDFVGQNAAEIWWNWWMIPWLHATVHPQGHSFTSAVCPLFCFESWAVRQ